MEQRAESDGTANSESRFTAKNLRRPGGALGPTEYLVTSVGETPAEERSQRMRAYYIAMILRLLCVASLAFVRGWWIAIPALGAILLPYFAVMIGNAIGPREGAKPDELTPQALTGTPIDFAATDGQSTQGLIVVDAPADRRSSTPQGPPTPPRVDADEPTQDLGEAAR